MAGANERDMQKLTLYEAQYFFYVNQGQNYVVDGMNDAEDYAEVRVRYSIYALTSIGFTLSCRMLCL